MTNTTSYISLAMVAIFLENAVFTRALGASRILRVAHKEQSTSKFVVMLTIMMTIGSAVCYPINIYLPSTGTSILRLLKPSLSPNGEKEIGRKLCQVCVRECKEQLVGGTGNRLGISLRQQYLADA